MGVLLRVVETGACYIKYKKSQNKEWQYKSMSNPANSQGNYESIW